MTSEHSQGLEELAKRDGEKPYDKLERSGTYDSKRTIFRDPVTGAEVWKLTHDPQISRHIYYDIPAWNADGSLLFFVSRRPGEGDGNWMMDADGGRIRELRIRGESGRVTRPLWSIHHPTRMYYASRHRDRTTFCSLNVNSGRRRELASVDLVHNVEFCPPSADEKKLLVRGRPDPEVKVWTVYLIDIKTGERQIVPIEGNIHRLRFTRAPDYSIFYNLNDPETEVRLGSYVIMPDGSGRTELPCGQAGHPDWAPDGHAWSYASESGIWAMDRDGTNRRQLVDLSAGMHGGWSTDGEWIVSDVTDRGPFANQIIMVHTEERGRIHRICSHNASYQGWGAMHPDSESTHPAPISSPDGTKIAFDSDMIGKWGELYVAVCRKPDPPIGLVAKRVRNRVELTWERPERSKELAEYLVYRSDHSGDGYQQLGTGTVCGEVFEDRVGGRGPWFYRVAAVEHSGLEGRPSEEIRVGRGEWIEPVRMFVEPELGQRAGLVDGFDGRTSSLRAIELKPGTGLGRVEVDVELPKPGMFLIWARVSGRTGAIGRFGLSCEGVGAGSVEAVVGGWSWVRALDSNGRTVCLALDEGSHFLTLDAAQAGVRLDRVLLTDDPDYLPTGTGGQDVDPPSRVEDVSVETGGVSELEVSWTPVSDSDFHHYNVYGSRDPDFSCTPQTLIASPSEPRWVDWGLPSATSHWSSTTYHYRVTAVDRSGNESEPSEAVWGRTGIHSWRSRREMERIRGNR